MSNPSALSSALTSFIPLPPKNNHEGNVPAITVRCVCRFGDRTPLPKLAVDADEEPEWSMKWRTMSRRGPLDPDEVKTARQKEMQCSWDNEGVMSTPPKRKHGHERDATQLASSGSILTKVAPKSHVTARVWCVRTSAMKETNRSSKQHRPLLCVACQEHVFRLEGCFLNSIVDVSRAHSHADAVRDVFARMPNEDPKDPGVCGKRRQMMYGSLDAAQRCENITPRSWRRENFPEAQACPCHLFHEDLHGDDFFMVGRREGRKHTPGLL